MTPSVSIVVTAYNRGEKLRDTLNSLLVQTYRDFELLICDDASSDGTEAVGREYACRDERVRYRRNKRNLGMPGNLNAGILSCRGEFVANLHDGDLYEPDLIDRWVTALKNYPRAAFVFNQYRALNQDGTTRVIYREPLPPVMPGGHLLETIFFRRWLFDSPVWGTVMARRSLYTEAGLFDPRFGCVADIDMWMRLAEKHDVAYVPEPLIALPSREAVPGNFVTPSRVVQRIFLESRVRHYRRRPLRLAAELGRHLSFVLASDAYFGALVLARAVRRFGGR